MPQGRGSEMKAILRLGAGLLGPRLPCSPPPAVPVAKQAARTSADARLKALYDGYAAWDAKESGYFENARGEIESTAYLQHVDEASQLRRAAHLKDLLTQ